MNFPHEIIFVKTIIRITITMIFLIFSELFWIVYFFKEKRKKKGFSGRIVSTFIIIMENLNSGLLVQILDSVVCEKINDNYYLSKDLNVSCSGSNYFTWVSKKVFSIIIFN